MESREFYIIHLFILDLANERLPLSSVISVLLFSTCIGKKFNIICVYFQFKGADGYVSFLNAFLINLT